MKYLIGHFDKCTGCGICQLVCTETRLGGYNPRLAFLDIEMGEKCLNHFVVTCRQCENPFCENACPTESIHRDEKTGALTVNRETCIGCGRCHEACPVHVIKVIDKKAGKCDLCGGAPSCVDACPAGAIQLVERRSAS